MNILVLNAGSSSLKYQLIDIGKKHVLAKGNCERIGLDGKFTHKTDDGRKIADRRLLPSHSAAFRTVIDVLTKGEGAVIGSVKEIDAVGHRIVNGGDRFSRSVLVTDQVLKDFSEVINFAPLHNPPAMAVIKECPGVLGEDVPNVLVFDTAFHQTMPPKAYIYGIPYKYYEKYKLRRYGAHGTSHRYVSLRCAELMGKKPEDVRIVTCHLGNGSSITAINRGKVADTSMGFTPLGGIIMGTRSGDLDPSVLTFLMEHEHLTPAEAEDLLNKKSGFLGLSQISSDVRDVEDAAAKHDKLAQLSLDIEHYQIKKFVGSYAAVMGGADAVVFTGGIGENDVEMRADVCADMSYMGLEIDPALNEATVHGKEGEISKAGSRVRTFVIPTNEEYMIAVDTRDIVSGLKK